MIFVSPQRTAEMQVYVGRVFDTALDIQFAEWRHGDQPWYVSNTHAISRAIGWQPRMELRAGCAKASSSRF